MQWVEMERLKVLIMLEYAMELIYYLNFFLINFSPPFFMPIGMLELMEKMYKITQIKKLQYDKL